MLLTMTVRELGFAETPLGELTLRCRTESRLRDREIFEVKLGDDDQADDAFTEHLRSVFGSVNA
jgi:hypothetical protein